MATDNDQFESKAAPEKNEASEADAPKKAQVKAVAPAQPKLPKSSETKVKFLPWFTSALSRFDGVKAHHMTAVRAYFRDMGLGEPETVEAYDEGLIKFGYRRKK